MALRARSSIRKQLLDDVYASSDERVRAPKYSLPADEMDPRHAYEIVHDELMIDGNARMNLATFCTTWADPEVHALMEESLDKNIVDKDEYPQTAEIETRCVHMIAGLWNSPDASDTLGTSTTGSSEAAELGGLAAKWRWRKRRAAEGKDASKPNFVCGPVQVCWEKFARYFDVEKREIPMDAQSVLMTPEEAVAACDENTIAVVVTFGQTFTGLYEDVASISHALDELQEKTGLDIPIHVDAASGGFLAPFVEPDLVWDFRLPRVASINASGHKMGLAPLGVGWVVWRDSAELPDELIFRVNYLGGEMATFNLNFSRPGGAIIAQYYNFLRLGCAGYARVHQAAYGTAAAIAEGVTGFGPIELIFDGDPKKGITAATWQIAEGANPGYNLFDLADRLRVRGWLVPAYTLPPNLQDRAVQRVLVRHGLSRDLGDLLLEDIGRELKHLEAHGPSESTTEKESGGFTHTAKRVIP